MTRPSPLGNRMRAATRSLKFENLENRVVLSADPILGAATFDAALVSEQAIEQQEGVELVTVEINGEPLELTDPSQQITVRQGDVVRITGIQTNTAQTEGVFAAEGYVRKLPSDGGASQVDYSDGRFSARADNADVQEGSNLIGGLADSWTVETGWDRINLSIMHYHESGVEVQSRFSFGLAVAEPDFQFDMSYFDQIGKTDIRVGDQVKIPVSWLNQGDGRYHNYAELDIYTAGGNEILWAGAVAGNADAQNPVTGVMENTRDGDGFDQYWTPAEEGEYALKFYLDPEDAWNEVNEANNFFEVRLVVRAANQTPVAGDDHATVNENHKTTINALANDSDPDGNSLAIVEHTEAAHGQVTLNDDGTFTYTPDEDFAGEDAFDYTISDADGATHSATVFVSVQEWDDGFTVDKAQGNEDSRIRLSIEVDSEQYEGVMVSDIPDGAELSHGKLQEDGSVFVKASQLKKLKVTPAHNSDVDFDLVVTPVAEGQTVSEASQTLHVTVDAVVDGARVSFNTLVADVGQVTDISGHMRQLDDDGSESTMLRVQNLPQTIEFTTGYRDGDDWWLEMSELPNTEISIGSDFDGDFSYYNGQYAYLALDIELITSEADSDETLVSSTTFSLWIKND